MSLTSWLRNQSGYPRFYWSSRDSDIAMAGVGVEATYAQPVPGSLGFLRFDNRRPTDALWAPFGETRFIVPQILKVGKKPEAVIPTPAVIPAEAGIHGSRVKPGMTSWSQKIESALQSIHQGTIQKVVLADRKTLEIGAPIDPIALLEKLEAYMPTAYHFLFEPRPGLAFLGASPEQLFKRVNHQIWSEAQAGTRPRNSDPNELLKNPKEGHEHDLVVKNILNAFHNICIDYGVTHSKEIVTLPTVQHLRTRLSGLLKPGITDTDILAALHPTAAVCGWPREEAFQVIRNLENFDRGFYAGALGYIQELESEFAVAIRCAIVEDCHLHLFGGAGMVEGSVADNEWQEINNKIAFWELLFSDSTRGF